MTAFSKLPGGLARLALIIQLVCAETDDAAPGAIDLSSIEAAEVLADWFANEAQRIYAMIDQPADVRELYELVDLIREHGGAMTARDLRRCRRKYTSTENAEHDLGKLVAAQFGAWEDAPATDRGGRPTRLFRLFADGDVDETYAKRGVFGGFVNNGDSIFPNSTGLTPWNPDDYVVI